MARHRALGYFMLVIISLLLLLVAMAACDTPPRTPVPTTPTAAPPVAPQVIERQPQRGQPLDLQSPIVLTFDRPMDHASVQSALSISPTVTGSFEWEGNELTFRPDQPWQRATRYEVTLTTVAVAQDGRPLAAPYAFQFDTVGYLAVASVQPAQASVDIAPDARITVAFDRPVVPLSAISGQSQLASPIELEPATAGAGEWLNTSIYTFQASPGLLPGATYRVSVLRERLSLLTDLALPEDFEWEFTTQLPDVIRVVTSDPAPFVGPSPWISVTFNMPMDHASVESRTRLVLDGNDAPIPGEFRWDGPTVAFRPSAPLSLDTAYSLIISSGATAAVGGQGMAEDYVWPFRTIEAPRIVRTIPAARAANVEPYSGLRVTFSSPMDPDSLLDNLTFQPAISATNIYTSWTNADTELYISFGARPSTRYSVTFGPDLRGRFGHRLGAAHQIQFTTRALPSSVTLGPDRVGSYSAYTATSALVSHVNVSSLSLSLYRVPRQQFVQINSGQWYQYWDSYSPAEADFVRRWSLPVPSTLNQGLSTDVPLAENGGPLPAGYYYLEVTAPGLARSQRQRQLLVVSPFNITLKATMSEVLAWCTDLRTGDPVASVPLTIIGPNGQAVVTGTTDSQGLLYATLPPATTPEGEKDPYGPVLALVDAPATPAAASTDWSRDISPWQFGLMSDPFPADYNVVLYTDRSIYRPGQPVYFKGIVRADDDAHYSLPANLRSVPVSITDSQGKTVFEENLPLNEMSAFHGELMLGEGAALGYYYLNAHVGERPFGTGFQVAEYRKPEFEVTATTDRDRYVQGDRITVRVDTAYYFGGPVANARVIWRLMSEDYYFSLPDEPGYQFTDVDYASRNRQTIYGDLLTTGESVTAADGSLTVTVNADVLAKRNSQTFTLEATVTDANNQQVAGRTSVVVHKGLVYIGLSPQRYVGAVGRPSLVDVLTVDPEGQPVGGVNAQFVFLQQEWYNVQEQADNGGFYWTYRVRETPVFTTTATTAADGTATVSFTPPRGGAYRVRASARDGRRNEVRSSAYIWVTGEEYVSWPQENNDRIELIADKESYEVGDTAQILVPSPFQGPVNALVTVERGHIYSRRVFRLAGNSEQIAIPITADLAPNAFVSVVLVKGADAAEPIAGYRVGYVALDIATSQQQLTVQITPDRSDAYRPGDMATFDVVVQNHRGQGVAAELSLQLVDLAVIALTGDTQDTLLDQFYRERGLAVRTGATLAISVDRYRLITPPPAGKGGDGGEGAPGIRSRFVDTAYWEAEVKTDAAGKARVSIELPDNLTTWRMTGKAVTADTLVGQGVTEIVVNKELLVRPVAPRLFVAGDQARLGAIVHNDTARTLQVDVALTGQGVDISGGTQRIEVPARGQGIVNWQVLVNQVDAASLTWQATSADLTDGVALTLPVFHYSTPEYVATAGTVPPGETRTERIQLPSVMDPSQGRLTIDVEPSLAAGMRSGLTYLEEYPYACVEQTVSRFLPNVVAYSALKQLGIEDPELEARLPQFVGVALQRLYAMQHYDGGWGWWTSDESNPFITAYVLLGMSTAHDNGFAVDPSAMDRAANYLSNVLDGQALKSDRPSAAEALDDANVRALVLFALAESGRGDLGRTVALFENSAGLDIYGRALLMMALDRLDPDNPARMPTLVSELTNAALLSATGAHWEEQEPDDRTMSTNTRTTALALQALVRVDPQNALIPNVVRWLVSTRQGGHWKTTQETAWSILALTEFMVSTGELQGNYAYDVSLNGNRLGEGVVTGANVDETRTLQVEVRSLLEDQANRIDITRQAGDGQLYYTMQLEYYLPAQDVLALNRGVIISRRYARLDAPSRPVDTVAVGEAVQVTLTVIAPNDLHYLVVEDPLPAGCEALDTSLKTTSGIYAGPQLIPEDGKLPYWWYFHHTELRDEKVALFATYLPAGTYEYTYIMRASVPGKFLTMPVQAYEMYFPEVFGRSDGGTFTITE